MISFWSAQCMYNAHHQLPCDIEYLGGDHAVLNPGMQHFGSCWNGLLVGWFECLHIYQYSHVISILVKYQESSVGGVFAAGNTMNVIPVTMAANTRSTTTAILI